MRPTLHDYVIERFNERELFPRDAYDFANLTNRAPRLGDFVPCDEDGLPIYKPEQSSFNMLNLKMIKGFERVAKQYQAAQDRVIFAGDWEVTTKNYNSTWIELDDFMELCFKADGECRFYGKTIHRIEDLPREIEFKEGVI